MVTRAQIEEQLLNYTNDSSVEQKKSTFKEKMRDFLIDQHLEPWEVDHILNDLQNYKPYTELKEE